MWDRVARYGMAWWLIFYQLGRVLKVDVVKRHKANDDPWDRLRDGWRTSVAEDT